MRTSFLREIKAAPPTSVVRWRDVINNTLTEQWDGQHARINVMALRNALPERAMTFEMRMFIEVDLLRYGWDCVLDKERLNWVCIPVDTQEPPLRNFDKKKSEKCREK